MGYASQFHQLVKSMMVVSESIGDIERRCSISELGVTEFSALESECRERLKTCITVFYATRYSAVECFLCGGGGGGGIQQVDICGHFRKL